MRVFSSTRSKSSTRHPFSKMISLQQFQKRKNSMILTSLKWNKIAARMMMIFQRFLPTIEMLQLNHKKRHQRRVWSSKRTGKRASASIKWAEIALAISYAKTCWVDWPMKKSGSHRKTSLKHTRQRSFLIGTIHFSALVSLVQRACIKMLILAQLWCNISKS